MNEREENPHNKSLSNVAHGGAAQGNSQTNGAPNMPSVHHANNANSFNNSSRNLVGPRQFALAIDIYLEAVKQGSAELQPRAVENMIGLLELQDSNCVNGFRRHTHDVSPVAVVHACLQQATQMYRCQGRQGLDAATDLHGRVRQTLHPPKAVAGAPKND